MLVQEKDRKPTLGNSRSNDQFPMMVELGHDVSEAPTHLSITNRTQGTKLKISNKDTPDMTMYELFIIACRLTRENYRH